MNKLLTKQNNKDKLPKTNDHSQPLYSVLYGGVA